MKLSVLAVIAIFLLTGSSMWTQTAAQPSDAPTIEQCRADFLLWNTNSGMDATLRPLAVADLFHRGQVMLLCSLVADSLHEKGNLHDLAESVRYSDLATQYMSAQAGRFHNYIVRHGEWQRFLNEDAAGER